MWEVNLPWQEMAPYIIQALALIPVIRSERTKAHENMRIAVFKAFYATEAYYERRSRGETNSKENELNIAELWAEASVLVERFNKDLAQRIGKKSQFWRDGAIWSDKEIESAGIQLDRVRQEVMILKKASL